MVFYIILRLSDIFKYGLWPLYMWRAHMNLIVSVFSVSYLWLCLSFPFSGGFTFFELMKRGVPLHLIDKYMNESKTSEKSEWEKKGSNWRLVHWMITQKPMSLLQIMAYVSLAWYALLRNGSIVRKSASVTVKSCKAVF